MANKNIPLNSNHDLELQDIERQEDEAELRHNLLKQWGKANLTKDARVAEAAKKALEASLGHKIEIGWLKNECADLADSIPEFSKFRDELMKRGYERGR